MRTQNHHLLGICFQAYTSIPIALQMGDFNAVVGIVMLIPHANPPMRSHHGNPHPRKTDVGAWRTEQFADVEPDFAFGSGSLLSFHRQLDRGGVLEAASGALHRNRVSPRRRT